MGLLVIATLRPACVRVCVRVMNSIREVKVERAIGEKNGEAERRKGAGREGGMEGKDEGCGLEYGFGFPSLRGEWKAIDSEAESKADRVAARGCTGTQWEHDLDTNKVSARPLTGRRDGKEREKRLEKDGWKKKRLKRRRRVSGQVGSRG